MHFPRSCYDWLPAAPFTKLGCGAVGGPARAW
jgi:hypothetical protein